jgi:hypothetical protein
MLTVYESWIRHVMNGLINPRTGLVRFDNLHDFDAHLRRAGFVLGWTRKYPEDGLPANGTMLFYWAALGAAGRGLGIRVKTHGEGRRSHYRAGRPHLSVCWFEGGIGKSEEKSKYTIRGVATFTVATGSGMSAVETEIWANATHFMFPGFGKPDWPNPRGLEGPDRLSHLNEGTFH